MRVQALQVFHMCLLLGFQGKYAIDGGEKLSYLTRAWATRSPHQGKSRGFAPRAERPDQVVNKRGSDVPLWALSSFFALLAICAYLGLKTHLTRGTQTTLAAYADLVKLAPRPAKFDHHLALIIARGSLSNAELDAPVSRPAIGRGIAGHGTVRPLARHQHRIGDDALA